MSTFRATVHGRDPRQQVTISHNGPDWASASDTTGLVVLLPDPVGLVEALLDVLSSEQRDHMRDYLGGGESA